MSLSRQCLHLKLLEDSGSFCSEGCCFSIMGLLCLLQIPDMLCLLTRANISFHNRTVTALEVPIAPCATYLLSQHVALHCVNHHYNRIFLYHAHIDWHLTLKA